MTTADLAQERRCSFCGKHQQDVAKLIAGPGVHICDDCVDLCNRIIAEELSLDQVRSRISRASGRPPHISGDLDHLTEEQLIDLMVRINRSHEGVDQNVQRVVGALRARNVSWSRIGEALGMTRQSAWERFSGEE